jgi:hypothetical protein
MFGEGGIRKKPIASHPATIIMLLRMLPMTKYNKTDSQRKSFDPMMMNQIMYSTTIIRIKRNNPLLSYGLYE